MNNTATFIIKEIPKKNWDEFVNKIDRKIYNKQKDCYEGQSIEKYLRELIIRLSTLDRADINNLLFSEIKIISISQSQIQNQKSKHL